MVDEVVIYDGTCVYGTFLGWWTGGIRMDG